MTATGWSRCSVRMSSSLDPTSAPGSTIRQCSPSPDATTQQFVPQIADGIPAMNTAELPRVVTTGQLTLEPAPIWAPQRSVLVGGSQPGWQPCGTHSPSAVRPSGAVLTLTRAGKGASIGKDCFRADQQATSRGRATPSGTPAATSTRAGSDPETTDADRDDRRIAHPGRRGRRGRDRGYQRQRNEACRCWILVGVVVPLGIRLQQDDRTVRVYERRSGPEPELEEHRISAGPEAGADQDGRGRLRHQSRHDPGDVRRQDGALQCAEHG